jgi:hypothetical protein
VANKLCSREEVSGGEDSLWGRVSVLVGLINADSEYRVHEGGSE